MGKPRKVHRQQRFQYDRNRSKEWKKLKKLPTIECKQIKEAWDKTKSVQKNMKMMGLSSNPNVTLKIHKPRKSKLETGEIQATKVAVAEGLEAEANAPQPKTLQFSEPETRYCIYMLEKYGDDYQAMAKDRKNYFQDTPKQIKRKITSFKSTPHQYSSYLKLKGENKLEELMNQS